MQRFKNNNSKPLKKKQNELNEIKNKKMNKRKKKTILF